MDTLPPRADIEQLRRKAKDRLQAARSGDAQATAWLREAGPDLRLSTAQLRLAREHGFSSWPQLLLEVARRRVLDLRSPVELAAFLRKHPDAATAELRRWQDHPLGASPLGYLAMLRYDTAGKRWRHVDGTAAAAHVLLAHGAPVDGPPDAKETPLITAASYGDAEIAAVLIAAGADVDAVAAADSGGVPGGSALLHAAVFGMTDVLDLLVAAGARIRSIEEASAVGDLSKWPIAAANREAGVRALVMAADHQRIAVIDLLLAAGVPIDASDERFGRQALRLAAANGRARSVAALLAHGADPQLRDPRGWTPLDHCRRGRAFAAEPDGHDAVETLLRGAGH